MLHQPLSPLNMMFINLAKVGCINSCDLIEVEGRVEQDLLQDALDICASRRVTCRSRIRREGLKHFWVEQPGPVRVPLEVVREAGPYIAQDALSRVACATWSRSFDLANEMPLRAVLWEYEDRSQVQLICSHVTADAQAGYRLADDLVRTYTALQQARHQDTDTGAAMVSMDLGDAPGSRLPTPYANYSVLARAKATAVSAWQMMCDVALPDHVWPVPRSKRGETRLQRVDLPASWLSRIKRVARAQGVTVHSLLLLALVRASAQAAGKEGVFRYTDQFSLRPVLGEEDGRVYDALTMAYNLRLDSRHSDARILQQIRQRIADMREGGGVLEYHRMWIYDVLSRFLPRRLATLWAGSVITKSNILISNPGKIPYNMEWFGASRIVDYFSFPQIFHPGRALLLFSTFRDSSRLWVVYHHAAFKDGVQGSLIRPYLHHIDLILDRLESAAGHRHSHDVTHASGAAGVFSPQK